MKKLDMILLNGDYYKKLSDKRASLNIGIILLGIIDMAIPVIDNFNHLFINKGSSTLFYNISLALLYVVLAGFVDVLFFCIPLFDIFKYFKRERNLEPSGFLTRFMKIYIIANFLILPATIIFYTATKIINYLPDSSVYYALWLIQIFITVWLVAAVARGLNAICGFHPGFKNIMFVLIFIWSYLLQNVLGFILNNWAMLLFR